MKIPSVQELETSQIHDIPPRQSKIVDFGRRHCTRPRKQNLPLESSDWLLTVGYITGLEKEIEIENRKKSRIE
jgi:hypothetical protein